MFVSSLATAFSKERNFGFGFKFGNNLMFSGNTPFNRLFNRKPTFLKNRRMKFGQVPLILTCDNYVIIVI